MGKVHDFHTSLKLSHNSESLPLWGEIYAQAFPGMVGFHSHSEDGDHQRLGIDRSVVLNTGKVIWIDEKIRGPDRQGRPYTDIALEYLSSAESNTPVWICKPLLCDYIAYANPPLGKCYMLPVIQLQMAWVQKSQEWFSYASEKRRGFLIISAKNKTGTNEWTTKSLCVPTNTLFSAIGGCLRQQITQITLALPE